MPGFDIEKLQNLPKAPGEHVWADYIELLCLANIDGEISKSDFIDRLKEKKDLGELSELEVEIDEVDGLPQQSAAEISDKTRSQVDNWFNHLSFRESMFKEFYPFSLSSNGKSLIRQQNMSLKRKFYVFFLLSANLRYNCKANRNALTKNFEAISKEALKAFLPKEARVHIFGTGAPSTTGRYIGNLWQKINTLAGDLGETVILPQNKISKYDTGDNGLDVVGWVPLGDRNEGLVILLGQCACTEEWVNKQHSSSAEAWSQVMTFKARPANVAFIPFFFRESDGTWHKPQDIHNAILIDRLRFIYLLPQKWRFLKSLDSYQIVENMLKQREPLF